MSVNQDLADRFEADAPLVVTPVVEDTEYGALVAMTVTADRVIDLAVAVDRLRPALARIAEDRYRSDPALVNAVAVALRPVLTVAVSAAQLDDLLDDIEGASAEPEWCDDCGEKYARVSQAGRWRCDPCQLAADEVADQADGRRWAR